MSKRHAEIMWSNERLCLIDRSSLGTMVNNRLLVPGEPYPLSSGDYINFAIYMLTKKLFWLQEKARRFGAASVATKARGDVRVKINHISRDRCDITLALSCFEGLAKSKESTPSVIFDFDEAHYAYEPSGSPPQELAESHQDNNSADLYVNPRGNEDTVELESTEDSSGVSDSEDTKCSDVESIKIEVGQSYDDYYKNTDHGSSTIFDYWSEHSDFDDDDFEDNSENNLINVDSEDEFSSSASSDKDEEVANEVDQIINYDNNNGNYEVAHVPSLVNEALDSNIGCQKVSVCVDRPLQDSSAAKTVLKSKYQQIWYPDCCHMRHAILPDGMDVYKNAEIEDELQESKSDEESCCTTKCEYDYDCGISTQRKYQTSSPSFTSLSSVCQVCPTAILRQVAKCAPYGRKDQSPIVLSHPILEGNTGLKDKASSSPENTALFSRKRRADEVVEISENEFRQRPVKRARTLRFNVLRNVARGASAVFCAFVLLVLYGSYLENNNEVDPIDVFNKPDGI